MSFTSAFELVTTPSGKIAKITITGDLDASSAPAFKTEVEKASAAGVSKLVLMLEKLDYMASAGLRVLVFAKQKMGTNVEIIMVGAQETVLEAITMTGLQHSVTLLGSYDAAKIEN